MPHHCLSCILHSYLSSAQKLFSQASEYIKSIIAPAHCMQCKKALPERMIFCTQCASQISPVVSFSLPITASKQITVHAISSYTEPIRTLIIAKSWADIVASNQLAELIWQHSPLASLPCDYLIPIPLHWLRRIKRGYNQTEEMAHLLAKKRGAQVATIIKRTRHTPFQSRMPYKQRHTNVQAAFTLATRHPEIYTGKHLVLVDDLMTSGATLYETARILLPLKPASITAIVAARVTH